MAGLMGRSMREGSSSLDGGGGEPSNDGRFMPDPFELSSGCGPLLFPLDSFVFDSSKYLSKASLSSGLVMGSCEKRHLSPFKH